MTTQPSAAPSVDRNIRRGRPRALLASWAALLIVLAAIAPVAQRWSGVPFDLISLVMLAPALACVVLLLRPAWAPSAWLSVGGRHVLSATSIALVAVVAFTVVLALLTGRTPTWPPSSVASSAWLFLLLQALGALCEEIGWRGLVQRAGEQLARPGVVSAVAGFLFGVTHIGYWSLGPVPVLTFALTAMLMSLTITTIYKGGLLQRMLPAVVVHLGLNLGIAALAQPGEPLATTLPALAGTVVMFILALTLKTLVRTAALTTRNPSSPRSLASDE